MRDYLIRLIGLIKGETAKIKQDIEEIKLFKYPNLTLNGDLQINQGQLSGFSQSSYGILPFLFDTTNKSFDFYMAFNTGSDITTPQNIIGSAFCMAIFIKDSQLNVRMSSNGTNWNLLNFIYTEKNLEANHPYYLHLSFSGLNYSIKLSEDGKEYKTITNLGTNQIPNPGIIYVGIGNNFNNPYLGTINLNKWEILFKGEHFWEGMDDAGLASRLATDLSNIDEAGEKRIQEISSGSIITRKYTDLLYSVKYETLDYEFAKQYFKTHYVPVGACSVVRKDNKIGRNLDWYYDNEVEFIVESESGLGRYASKGFAGTISSLTKDEVAKGITGEIGKILPFRMLDGINEKGLMCNVNVVSSNTTRSLADTGTIPTEEQKDEICTSMIVRYILDNFSTAQEACDYIQKYVKVYPPIVDGNKTDLQVFVADKNTTKILTFEGVNTYILDDEFHGVMTNFRLKDTMLDNTNYYSRENSGIEDYGSGIERANLALNLLNSGTGINLIMNTLYYTNAYAENATWYTEFVGLRDTTIHSDDSIFQEIQANARQMFLDTTREKGDIWHTTHSIIYDLDKLSAEYITQEIQDDNTTFGEFEVLSSTGVVGDFYTKEESDLAELALSKGINQVNNKILEFETITSSDVLEKLNSFENAE
ncbi:MAG: linear amide C-N hydrolase [bacterium]|nr:linear amide C-N hydrolase [bacterium]